MSEGVGSVGNVQRDVEVDIDPASLAEAVDPGSYERGLQYVRQHAVVRALWKLSAGALAGTVRGQYGNVYTTTARFSCTDGVVHRFERGECSCPVRYNCKHVVALVLTATGALRPDGKGHAKEMGAPEDEATAGAGHAMWERSLASLLASGKAGSPGTVGLPGTAASTALAIELTLSVPQPWSRQTRPDPLPQLLARLVRPGKNGWVAGGLSWSQLGHLHYSGEYRAPHVRWLREFYALYKSGGQHSAYSSYGEEKTITLSAFESTRLWPLLDEAGAIGLQLVHARKRLGPLDSYTHAELCLDVTGDADTLSITPVVIIGGTPSDAVPVTFIGPDGHGLVYTGRGDVAREANRADWPLRLAKLASPVPPSLQHLARQGQPLRIPAADHARFRAEYYPRLRQMATVMSSDGSFIPPAIADPTLVLHAAYGTGHELDLRWEWVYEIGESRRRAPLSPDDDPGYRDLKAEQAIVAALDVGLEAFGLRNMKAGRPSRRP